MSLISRLKEDKDVKGGIGAKIGQKPKGDEVDPLDVIKAQIQDKLLEKIDEDFLDIKTDAEKRERLKPVLEELYIQIAADMRVSHPTAVKNQLVQDLLDDVVGLGPMQRLLDDDDISEVMVNGPNMVYIEKKGRLTLSDVKFRDNHHVLHVIEKIVSPLGRRCDESSPIVDARLKDGSRVNAIIPPLALNGPTITIRKFKKDPIVIDDLIRFGSVTREMADFLDACVKAMLNIVVSGGTGSGKTTTLNVLSSFIPDSDRIITVEDAAELQLRQDHVVRLETRPANIEGTGAVSIRDLVKNCLRMRPERIVVGECRGGEALDMLQAMNTGHDGSLTTGHANTPRDMIARLETMCLMAGMDLPVRAIREQIASAVHLIVQQSRLKDGSRKITNITEVQGMEGEQVVLQDIFIFEQQGLDEKGKIIGKLKPTGIRPGFMHRFEEEGIKVPADLFVDKSRGW